MAKLTHKEKWHEKMLAIYGSEEAVSEAMRKNAKKSTRNSKGPWYFSKLKDTDPEKLKDIAREGNKVRKIKEAYSNGQQTEEET